MEIRFNPNRTIRLPRAMSARYSTPRTKNVTPSEFYTAHEESARASTSQIREELESVEIIRISQNKIPQGIYSQTQSRESPTPSEMSFHIND